MDRGAWPFSLMESLVWLISVSVCEERRRENMKKKREDERELEREDDRQDQEIKRK